MPAGNSTGSPGGLAGEAPRTGQVGIAKALWPPRWNVLEQPQPGPRPRFPVYGLSHGPRVPGAVLKPFSCITEGHPGPLAAGNSSGQPEGQAQPGAFWKCFCVQGQVGSQRPQSPCTLRPTLLWPEPSRPLPGEQHSRRSRGRCVHDPHPPAKAACVLGSRLLPALCSGPRGLALSLTAVYEQGKERGGRRTLPF